MIQFFITRALPLGRTMILLCVLMMAVFAAIILERDTRAYDEAVVAAQEESERLLHIISDHVELTFLAADITLKRAVERQYMSELFGNNLTSDIQNHFVVWVNATPQIAALLLTDSNGRLVAYHGRGNKANWKPYFEDVSQKPFFLNTAASADPEYLHIESGSEALPIEGQYVLMSRKVVGLDGNFDGIVLAVIDGNYLIDYVMSLEKNKQTEFAVIRDDRKSLINGMRQQGIDWVYRVMNQAQLQQKQSKSQVIQVREIERNGNVRVQVSAPERTAPELSETALMQQSIAPVNIIHIQQNDAGEQFHLITFSELRELGIMLALVHYEGDVFNEWNETRSSYLLLLGVFATFVFVISMFAIAMAIQTRRAETSQKSAVMASQAKSEFLAHMSHELRTPLNAVIGFSEMLEAGYFGKLNAKQNERVHDIHMCGTHLLELINDILEFSKGEAGKLELRDEIISPAALVEDVLRLFREKLHKEEKKITVSIAEGMPKLRGDMRKIKQILINLLSNASKFTEKGGEIEIMVRPNAEGEMAFTITDTGIGMNEEDIPQALSAFGQVHNDPRYGGTGLGLPLCKMLTEMHGGTFKLRSKKGVGTKVTITFPAQRVVFT